MVRSQEGTNWEVGMYLNHAHINLSWGFCAKPISILILFTYFHPLESYAVENWFEVLVWMETGRDSWWWGRPNMLFAHFNSCYLLHQIEQISFEFIVLDTNRVHSRLKLAFVFFIYSSLSNLTWEKYTLPHEVCLFKSFDFTIFKWSWQFYPWN